jgi:methyltransferase (TIGR00027 family)
MESDMFHRPRTIIYKAIDLSKARDWYSKILGLRPTLDSPYLVSFSIEDYSLCVVKRPKGQSKNDSGPIVYWEVDNVEEAYQKLLQNGAASSAEIRVAFGSKRASVIDPFDNILGISERTIQAEDATVDEAPSKTAMGVTLLRAIGAIDEREEIRGNDHLASAFLSNDQKTIINEPALRAAMISYLPGMYEYVIARTMFFDRIVLQALKDNIPQIVFLGAGYDSRPYRFVFSIKDTTIFELDAPTTQENKIKLLQQANISIPGQVKYVPINFNTDSLKDVLLGSGYRNDWRALFVWEGVTYYLFPDAVEETLKSIASYCSAGTTLCFDYGARWPEMLDAHGVRKAKEAMGATRPGEPIRFQIERGTIESFLSQKGFRLIEHLTAEDMENKYLTLKDGSSAGKVLGNVCLAHASVVA